MLLLQMPALVRVIAKLITLNQGNVINHDIIKLFIQTTAVLNLNLILSVCALTIHGLFLYLNFILMHVSASIVMFACVTFT